jgi:hypothetical protein
MKVLKSIPPHCEVWKVQGPFQMGICIPWGIGPTKSGPIKGGDGCVYIGR